MRIPPYITTSIVLIAVHGTVSAGPLRACAEVSARVEGAVRPLLASRSEPHVDAAPAGAPFRDCLSSRNFCSVVYSARSGKEALVAGDVTTDLPAQYGLGQGESSVIVLVRSIPQVRNDSNRYCLVSEKQTGAAAPGHQWAVYGWVIAPSATEALPLPRQVLDENAASDPHSLRGLAAALWFFAEGMSGTPPSGAERLRRSGSLVPAHPAQKLLRDGLALL
jgi:hypothetical protein